VRILAIGSSSTQGVGASSQAASYPAQLQQALTRQLPRRPIFVFNAGVAGETADATVNRLNRELDRYKPDLVLWQVGTNDALTASMQKYRFASQVERGASEIERHGADVILIDPQFLKKTTDPKRYEQFVRIVSRAALHRHIDLFSRHRLMKAWEAAQPGSVDTMLSRDALHMNDHGYACLARLLASHILSETLTP
jgi:acyl-CoA thioesterase-1